MAPCRVLVGRRRMPRCDACRLSKRRLGGAGDPATGDDATGNAVCMPRRINEVRNSGSPAVASRRLTAYDGSWHLASRPHDGMT